MTKRERIGKKLREQVRSYERLVDQMIKERDTPSYMVAISFWVASRKMYRIFLRETSGG